ncbi:MAG: energy-coupling factor transporter transmembrane protein EcfT [Candidatus Bipolaricaulota bacterium]|nr:MAG: energy-coupling factor transporter transmembrane protein EcfT [Candidatus Bipolaricaulota bacterium]
MIPRRRVRSGVTGLGRAGPAGNVLLLAGFLTIAFGSGSAVLKVVALLLVVFLAWWCGERPRDLLRSLRFVVLFAVLLFAAQALATRDGDVVFRVGPGITDSGLRAGAGMALRFLLILTSSFLFVLVTDPDALAHAIIRLGIPYRYGFLLILALRFVPFFREELRVVREAQRLRGIRTSVRSPRWLRRAIRFTFVPVLVSALLRVDTITMSMKGRAFGLYAKRTSTQDLRWSVGDTTAAALSLGMVALVIASRRGSWP